jgi:hypothetical protein
MRLTPTADADLGGRPWISMLSSGRQDGQPELVCAHQMSCGDRYGSVSVVAAVVGGLPARLGGGNAG